MTITRGLPIKSGVRNDALARWVALCALAAVGLVGCGAAADARSPAAASIAAPAPPVAQTELSLVVEVHAGASLHSFLGGDDHLTVVVDNRGRDLQDLVFMLPAWVADHSLAMGTSKSCDLDLEAGAVHCGRVPSGSTFHAQLRALPERVGSFHYLGSVYDAEASQLMPVMSPEGKPATIEFDEQVDAVKLQIPGYPPDPEPPSQPPR